MRWRSNGSSATKAEELNTGGDTEAALPTHPAAIVHGDLTGVELRMPPYQGTYRLFAVVRDGKGGAAMANLPLRIEHGSARPPAPAKKGTLPLVIVGEGRLALHPVGLDRRCQGDHHGSRLQAAAAQRRRLPEGRLHAGRGLGRRGSGSTRPMPGATRPAGPRTWPVPNAWCSGPVASRAARR